MSEAHLSGGSPLNKEGAPASDEENQRVSPWVPSIPEGQARPTPSPPFSKRAERDCEPIQQGVLSSAQEARISGVFEPGARNSEALAPQLETSRPLNLEPVANQLYAIAELLRTGRLAALSRLVATERPTGHTNDISGTSPGECSAQPAAIGPDKQAAAFSPARSNGAPMQPMASCDEQTPSLLSRRSGHDLREHYAHHARQIYASRRKRCAIFDNAELFGEPAWDILLDLYIAHAEGKQVSVSSACIGSAAPSTTGLRWLGILAQHDLVVREHDPDDQRRVLVHLSEGGLQAMDQFFASAIAHADQRPASA